MNYLKEGYSFDTPYVDHSDHPDCPSILTSMHQVQGFLVGFCKSEGDDATTSYPINKCYSPESDFRVICSWLGSTDEMLTYYQEQADYAYYSPPDYGPDYGPPSDTTQAPNGITTQQPASADPIIGVFVSEKFSKFQHGKVFEIHITWQHGKI